MNTCSEIMELLPLYVDDALTETEKNIIEEHLNHCHKCKKEVELLTEIREILLDVPEEEIPEEFDIRLKNALLSEKKKKIKKKYNYRRLSAISAVFVVGIFAVAMYNSNYIFNENEYNDLDMNQRIGIVDIQEKGVVNDNEDSISSDMSREISEESLSDSHYYDYYLEMIEKDLEGISYTIISNYKNEDNTFSFLVRLDEISETRLYNCSERGIQWEITEP